MWNIRTYDIALRRNDIAYIQYNEGKLTAFITFCVETAFQNALLKESYRDRNKEEEEVSSSCMTVRTKDDTGI